MGGPMSSKNKLLVKIGVHVASLRAYEGRIALWTVHVASVRAHSYHMVFWTGYMGIVHASSGTVHYYSNLLR